MPDRNFWKSTGARKCLRGCRTTLLHDVSMTVLTFWRHFYASLGQTFRHQRIRVEPNRTFLDWKKCSYLNVKLIKQNIFKPKCNGRKKSDVTQEKESVMVVRFELKIPSLGITVRHHSANLVMPKSYPRDRIFNPNLTTIKDSYNPRYHQYRTKLAVPCCKVII